MSLFGALNTSISGMAAQSTKLSTIGDNIANASTTGYKRADAEFETLLGNEATSDYQSGGVQSVTRYGVTEQGLISSTSSTTDLAVSGNGFFVVQDSAGGTALTRAGSFVPDASGDLINTAGYKLMGYSLSGGSAASAVSVVNISSQALAAAASSTGTLSVNLPSTAAAVAAASLPSSNAAGATYTAKTSLVAYDNLGTAVNLDVYLTKSGANTWEAAVYNQAGAASGGGFPYSAGPMTTQALTFDATTGNLSSGSTLSVAIPNGNTVAVDMSKSTQLATDFSVSAGTVDGSSPSKLDHITIGKDGTVTSVYANGITNATYRIPLANVQSPNNLTPLTGNVYAVNGDSGPMVVGDANAGGLGQIDSASLESSTVDLATELTNMISAQRGYEANSKVLQTTSDMLSVLNNLHF